MLENIRLSFQGIWSHKMRSFLTMLGIIIGIAAIIAIVSTIKGTNEQIKQNLVGSGNNTVEVKLYQNDYEYQLEYEGIPSSVPLISKDTLKDIQNVENVESASLYLFRSYADNIFYNNTCLNGGKIYGIDANYFSTCGYVIKNCRGFADKDYSQFRKVAIVDQTTADNLFAGESPIGKTLEIKGEPFTVVGLCAKSNAFQPVIK